MLTDPNPKPVIQPYMPPVTYHNQLEVVRIEDEASKDQSRKMEGMSLRFDEAIPQAKEEIPSNHNGSNYNPHFNFIINDLASVPTQVAKTINNEV